LKGRPAEVESTTIERPEKGTRLVQMDEEFAEDIEVVELAQFVGQEVGQPLEPSNRPAFVAFDRPELITERFDPFAKLVELLGRGVGRRDPERLPTASIGPLVSADGFGVVAIHVPFRQSAAARSKGLQGPGKGIALDELPEGHSIAMGLEGGSGLAKAFAREQFGRSIRQGVEGLDEHGGVAHRRERSRGIAEPTVGLLDRLTGDRPSRQTDQGPGLLDPLADLVDGRVPVWSRPAFQKLDRLGELLASPSDGSFDPRSVRSILKSHRFTPPSEQACRQQPISSYLPNARGGT
jgi:hypothetical protein